MSEPRKPSPQESADKLSEEFGSFAPRCEGAEAVSFLLWKSSKVALRVRGMNSIHDLQFLITRVYSDRYAAWRKAARDERVLAFVLRGRFVFFFVGGIIFLGLFTLFSSLILKTSPIGTPTLVSYFAGMLCILMFLLGTLYYQIRILFHPERPDFIKILRETADEVEGSWTKGEGTNLLLTLGTLRRFQTQQVRATRLIYALCMVVISLTAPWFIQWIEGWLPVWEGFSAPAAAFLVAGLLGTLVMCIVHAKAHHPCWVTEEIEARIQLNQV